MLEWLRSKRDGVPRIKGYEIGEQIFAGAFSNIYRAYHTRRKEQVALKILTRAGSRIARRLDRNQATSWEGELLSVLKHPNIVTCIEYGTLARGTRYWLALEYLESKLGTYIGRCHNVEEENELLDILAQLISAVRYLHERGLVHRDICLGNIMLASGNVLKLIDFGLTVPIDSSVLKGRAGTPSYMAPEMIKKWQYVPATDIYSFGVVMYELVTGRKPFSGLLPEQRMTRSLNVNPMPPSQLGRYCAPEVERLMMRCLAKDPAARAQSAGEVEDALFLIRRRRGLV